MEDLSGLFITFEGIEGCGKTTQIGRLAHALKQQGFDIVVTREPGGCQISDKIRSILLDSNHEAMVPETELLLYTAARAQHIAQVVRPALEQGKVVLCDRFCDATLAYQGFGRHLDIDTINQLNHYACQGVTPNMTLLLDLPVETGLGRARSRNAQSEHLDEDRFEQESLQFHQRIREAYLEFSRQHSSRIKVIDATGDFDAVYQRIDITVTPFISDQLSDK